MNLWLELTNTKPQIIFFCGQHVYLCEKVCMCVCVSLCVLFFFFGEFIGSINTFSSSNINLSPSIDRSQPHLQTWLWPAVPSVSSPVCIWWLLRSASSFTDFVCVCVNRKLRSSLYDWKTVKIIHGLLWHCFDSHRSIDSDGLKSFIYWSPHAISH